MESINQSHPQFFKHGMGQVTHPFSQLELQPYSEGVVGIVLHCENTVLLDDENIHIYYLNPVTTHGNTFGEVIEFTDMRPEITGESWNDSSKSRPTTLYVREGKSFEELLELTEFLHCHFYSSQQSDGDSQSAGSEDFEPEEAADDTRVSYKQFITTIEERSTDSLEDYLHNLLKAVGLDSEELRFALSYLNVFQVGFVDEDVNGNPLGNYELLEFVGDLAAWKPLNEIFIDYCEQHSITITEPAITSFHRSYASKEKQAQIAKELRLYVFLKKRGEVIIDTYEDLFEALVGSMFLVSFQIRAVLAIDLRLHERFLKWVYQGRDLSGYVEKPEITEFYEQMRVLVGGSSFKERIIGTSKDTTGLQAASSGIGIWVMRGERNVYEKIKDTLTRYSVCSPGLLTRFITELSKMIAKPYRNDEHAYESRRAKYHEITEYVKALVNPALLQKMSNDRNMVNWSETTKQEFDRLTGLIGLTTFTLNQRFTDKSKTASYWLLAKDDTTISTEGYDSSEDPEILLTLLRDNLEGRQSVPNREVELIPYEAGKHDHFMLDNQEKKWFLKGNPLAIEARVAQLYEEGEGKFFLIIKGAHAVESELHYNLEYDPRPPSYVSEGIDWSYLRSLFTANDFKPHLPPAIHRYIGDRAAYGYTALIAIMQHQITNVHHLTAVRNYYRSKELKKEITRLLGFKDAKGQLIPFDQLVGMNLHSAERIISYLYMFITIDSSVIHTPKKRLESLRNVLWQTTIGTRINQLQKQELSKLIQDQAQSTTLTKEQKIEELKKARARLAEELKKVQLLHSTKSKVLTRGNLFTYETSRGEQLSLAVSGFNASRVKDLFDSYVLAMETRSYPNINQLRNSRFLSLPGADSLRQSMEFRSVQEWQLSHNMKRSIKRGMILRFTEPSGIVRFVNGTSIESIMKQL